ncbi:hypothetical protein BDV96DRAFT_583783 [Lophiotrema nucula]|uniref:Tubby C-terminal-like domain-containing protein n=1 Tax=Lophiotrema nucula TaxID=690887 RepID=A0A6A5YUT3_9PLEO|nr:hypothetical protein BDV96DRAFT_583783 [Lophiotrema nucula]
MDSTNSHQQNAHPEIRTLNVDFSWRKNTILMFEAEGLPPSYIGKCNPLTMKTVFKSGPSAAKSLSSDSDVDSVNLEAVNDDVIGQSKVKIFHIDCNTTIRGREVRLSADSRLMTRYKYPSIAFAENEKKPTIMTWKCNSKWRCFDFDLLDESGKVVAKFLPKYLGVRKWATIQMYGPRAWDSLATEEVIITGLSLYFCMIYRASSPVPLVGALTSRKGKDFGTAERDAQAEYERNMAGDSDGLLQPNGSTLDPKEVWSRVNEGAETTEVYAH